jgi:hypothetical protein
VHTSRAENVDAIDDWLRTLHPERHASGE